MDYFLLSKIVAILLEPGNALFLVLVAITVLLWTHRIRAARRLATTIVGVLAGLVFVPLGSFMVLPLEQRFPAPASLPAHVDGIVVLGGAQLPLLSIVYGQAALNQRAERLTTFLALANRYPNAKLIASGGSGDLRQTDANEAVTTRMFLNEQGFNSSRVVYEARSRNTYENGLFTTQLASPKPGEVWLLITSAADLPRAMGVFRKLGWRPLAVPCDYNVLPPDWTPTLGLVSHLSLLQHGFHEWIGLSFYFLTGKTDSLFPRP